MTRIYDCVEFIQVYAQHGFWGGFVRRVTVGVAQSCLGRLIRQSLSSYTSVAGVPGPITIVQPL